MSGGVDSSVTAYLLKEKGFEVAGLTMCFGVKEINKKKPACCGPQAIEDAKRVSLKLKIPHYVLDFSKDLEKNVINKFISEYTNGRTPNPCVDCNRRLKFGILLQKALSMGFDFLATGHYAKIEKKDKGFYLKRAKDNKKDQSYFLYSIKKEALKSILFPLGSLTKKEVRNIAKSIKLPVGDKHESQDICFISQRNYHGFLSERISAVKRGPVLDLKGNALGEHKGIFFYTVGQRRGLGIGYKYPLYVLSKDAEKNEVIVGEKKDLKSRGLLAGEANILVKALPKKAYARIRYNEKEARCKISICGKKIKVLFKEPQEAITPGQSVVFYDNDTVLGGGVIEKAIRR